MDAVQFSAKGNATPKQIFKSSPFWYYRVLIPDEFDPTIRHRRWLSSGSTDFNEANSFHYKNKWLDGIQKRYKRKHLKVAREEVRSVEWLLNYVLAIKAKKRQAKTLVGYKSAFKAFCAFLSDKYSTPKKEVSGGRIALMQITTPLCREFFETENAVCAPVSFQRHYTNLRSAFTIAVNDGIIQTNPFVPIAKPEVDAPAKDWFASNDKDFSGFIDSLPIRSFEDKSYKRMLILARYTGLRRKEICHIREEDVYHEHQSEPHILVRSSNVTGEFRTKNGKSRKVLLFHNAISVIREMKAMKSMNTNLAIQHSPYLFPTEKGKVWREERLSKRFNVAREKIFPTREHLTFHSLRHSFAYWFIDYGMTGGFDIYSVLSAILGHSDPSFTARIYAKPENISNFTPVFEHFNGSKPDWEKVDLNSLYTDPSLGIASPDNDEKRKDNYVP
jgi:integrase